MRRKRYTSDLTEAEWSLIEPLIPPAKTGRRPRTTNMGKVVNAIFYVLKTGCQWANLPGDFPPVSTVFDYYTQSQAFSSQTTSLNFPNGF
jgi:putative transposase